MKKRRTKTKRPAKLSDQIRQAMDESGVTRYRIAQETGLNESALGKFYHGQRGLSIEALDRLGEYLRLEIKMHGPRPKEGT